MAGENWQVLWKVPASGEWRLPLEPRFPDGCADVGERTSWDVDAALTSRWTLHCAGGLAGGRMEILGLPATMTDVLVRVAPADGAITTVRLTPGAPAIVLAADGSSWQTRRDLSAARRRAHPAGRRPSAVRPRAAAAGARLGSPDRHDHRLHRRPQHHARPRHLRPGDHPPRSGRGADRAQHRFRRGRDRACAPGRSRHHRPGPGWSRSASACSTAWASPGRCARSDCLPATSRWRCSCSMSGSSWVNSCSSPWCFAVWWPLRELVPPAALGAPGARLRDRRPRRLLVP